MSVVLTLAACGGAAAQRAVPVSDPILAFQRDRSVWAVGTDWVPHRLTSGWLHGWSSDGRTILVEQRRGLMLYELSSGQVRMTGWRRAFEADELEAAWSPAGNRIALLSSTVDGYGKVLAVMNPRRGKPIPIVEPGRAGSPDAFAWSPDGQRLAYTTCFLVGPGSHGEGHCQLMVVDVVSRRRDILRRNLSWTRIAWSPDGSAVTLRTRLRNAAEEGAYVEGSAGIWMLELRSRTFTRIVAGETTEPAWRPDGHAIAYITSEEFPSDPARSRQDTIWVAARNGTRTELTLPHDEAYSADLAWSPDGNLIATDAWRRSDVRGLGLRVFDAGTGRLVYRTNGAEDRRPRWRPR